MFSIFLKPFNLIEQNVPNILLKIFDYRFFFLIVLLSIITGCQLIKNDPTLQTTEISKEVRLKILQEIYLNKDELTLCNNDFDQSLSLNSSSVYPLSNGQYLVEILCFFGAYQGNYQYFFYQSTSLNPKIELLSFQEFIQSNTNDLIVQNNSNLGGIPDFDLNTKNLTIFRKYRGLGDCGVFARYEWRQSRFELLEYRIKDKCDGNYLQPQDYLQIYP